MSRLAWLVGPPGAGKSTFALRQREFSRVVELTAMLGPLVNAPHLRKGVLTANGKLIEAIRAVELHPANAAEPPVLIVAGLVPEEALFPLRPGEDVFLLLPERGRWEQQFLARPVGAGSSAQYDDVPYARTWYHRFEDWVARGLPLRRLDLPFEAELIGQVCP